MGAIVRYLVDGKPQWLAKLTEQPMHFEYVSGRERAHVFPSHEAATAAAFSPDRNYHHFDDVTIIPV
jgi:hypothetical protein